MIQLATRHRTVPVRVGGVTVGGGAPVVVQSMTMTDTADAAATARQCVELWEAGSEIVRVTVNVPEAAAAVPEIKRRMLDAGCTAPLVGDFHYNGHLLLTRVPECAAALDKYRINPGNVGTGRRRDEQFSTICQVARDHGSRCASASAALAEPGAGDGECRRTPTATSGATRTTSTSALSALQSTESGLTENQIIISCKVSLRGTSSGLSRAREADAAAPHLRLTEAGMGAGASSGRRPPSASC